MIRTAVVPQDARAITDAALDSHAEWPELLPVIIDGAAVIRVYARSDGGTGRRIIACVEPGVVGADGTFYSSGTGDDRVFWPAWRGDRRDGREAPNWNARRVMRPFFAVRVPVEYVTIRESRGPDYATVIRDEYGPDCRPAKRKTVKP